jgi:uncharacterized protein (DUF1015 family)
MERDAFMAFIRPFKATRYASEQVDISTRIAPPYDVIDAELLTYLTSRDPYCAARLELTEGTLDSTSPDSRYIHSKQLWDRWCTEGVLRRDDRPAIYLLEQSFAIEGFDYNRISFIVEMKLYDFDERVVLPHELTLPKSLGDRYQMIAATQVNYSPVFGLYCDPLPAYHALVEQAKAGNPLARAIDIEGVRNTLWAITDQESIDYLVTSVAHQQVFIADGHHRYTVANAWKNENRAAQDRSDYDPLYDTDHIMIALANMDDPQLLVQAYHRAAKAPHEFSKTVLLENLAACFEVKLQGDENFRDVSARPTFIVAFSDKSRYTLTVKEGIDLEKAIPGPESRIWKELDVTVLHELVIKPYFAIDSENPETLSRICYSNQPTVLEKKLFDGDVDAVFIMRPTKLEQLKSVSCNGEIMPQKSTFFYPKQPSGMVFRDMNSHS